VSRQLLSLLGALLLAAIPGQAQTAGATTQAELTGAGLTDVLGVTAEAEVVDTTPYAANFEADDTEFLSITDAAGPLLGFGDADWTIAGWYNLESVVDTIILFSKAGTNKHEYWAYVNSAGRPFASVLDGGFTARTTIAGTNGDFAADTWVFFVVYFDESAGANGTLYLEVDDGATKSGAAGGAVGTSDGPFQVGARTAVDAENMDGLIGYSGVWSRLLTGGEKTSLDTSGPIISYADLTAGQQTGLISWWDYGEESGARVDAHTNGYNLTDNNDVGRAEVVWP